MDDMSMLTERLAEKEMYISQLERQINEVMRQNQMLKSALDALRNL